MVQRLFLEEPWGCLRFVIVVFPDHTHYIFLLTKLAQVSVIMSVIDSLALLKAVQFSRKCLMVSSPFLHNKHVGSFWWNAARLLWSMYVPVTSFSFVLIQRIALAFPIPFLDGDVPSSPSYGVYISQLIRFARVCSNVEKLIFNC